MMNRWLLCIMLLIVVALSACTNSESSTAVPTSPPPSPSVAVSTAAPRPSLTTPPTAAAQPRLTATPGEGSLSLERDTSFSFPVSTSRFARYTLEADVGQGMRVAVYPEDDSLDLRLSVFSPGEYTLAEINRTGPGEPEVLPEFQFPLAGLYTLRVEVEAGSGMMRGEFSAVPADARTGGGDFGQLNTDSAQASIDARIEAADTFHTYTFDARQDAVVVIEAFAAAEDLDLYFYVFGPDAALVGLFDNERSPSDPAMHDGWLRQGGAYAVMVGARTGTGAYQMVLAPGG
jgi:hypothetical protein